MSNITINGYQPDKTVVKEDGAGIVLWFHFHGPELVRCLNIGKFTKELYNHDISFLSNGENKFSIKITHSLNYRKPKIEINACRNDSFEDLEEHVKTYLENRILDFLDNDSYQQAA